MRKLLGTEQKTSNASDALALDEDIREVKRLAGRIERDYAYIYHGFTFFDYDRLKARNGSFETSFAKLDRILRRLDKHIQAIGRNAG